jgi:tetratricopeptide (TPR) repeat protein
MPTPPAATALVQRGWAFLQSQQPLAAWAAWQQALRLDPGHEAASQALAHLAASPELPPAARTTYRFRTPTDDARRLRWDEALRGDLADLAVAADTFDRLARSDPDDADARYNLGLCLAWLGRNAEAVAALEDSIRLDAPARFEPAVEAATLALVLRQGAGAEPLADDFRHTLEIAWPDHLGDPIEWLDQYVPIRPLSLPTDPITGQPPQGVRVAEWLDRPMPEPSPDLTVEDIPVVRATVVAQPGRLQLSSPRYGVLPSVEAVLDKLLLGDDFHPIDRRSTPLPIPLLDSDAWQFRIPERLDEADRIRLCRESIERFYEREWAGDPRPSLGESPDRHIDINRESTKDPNRDPAWLARLAGVIRLREQLAGRPQLAAIRAGYPFDRLRRRLGLPMDDPDAVDPADYSAMSREELEALDLESLDEAALVEVARSANGIDNILASRVARLLAERDPSSMLRLWFPDLLSLLVVAAIIDDEPDVYQDWLDRMEPLSGPEHALELARFRRTLAFLRRDRAAQLAACNVVADLARDDPTELISAAFNLEGLNDLEGAATVLRRAAEVASRQGNRLLERDAHRRLNNLHREQP